MQRVLCLLMLLFPALAGCSMWRDSSQDSLTPRPWGQDRVLLHRPGSIMLGPGLGKNAWRWLGDGEWGF